MEAVALEEASKKKNHRMSLNLGYFGGNKEKRRSTAIGSLSPEFHAATANH